MIKISGSVLIAFILASAHAAERSEFQIRMQTKDQSSAVSKLLRCGSKTENKAP